jgi:outer membrane protein insertion porin family
LPQSPRWPSAFSLAAPQAQAQAFRFSSFQIEGNQRITDETIIAFTGHHARGRGVRRAGERCVAEFAGLGPVRNGGADPARQYAGHPRGGVPTINRIAIEGNRRIDDDDLLGILQSQSRRVYSPATAEQDAAAIAEAYRVSGRLTATVNPVIIRRGENRVDLVFEVTEGRVVETQRIAFVGNREYSDRRLRRVLESTQAGLFSRSSARTPSSRIASRSTGSC